MAWNDYRSSPPPGTALGHRDDLVDRSARSVLIDSGKGGFPVLLVASKGMIRAFVNSCPHQDLPLDYRSSDIISADGAIVLCSNHQAGFRIDDGIGVLDLGHDCDLDVIPITIDADGTIRISVAG